MSKTCYRNMICYWFKQIEYFWFDFTASFQFIIITFPSIKIHLVFHRYLKPIELFSRSKTILVLLLKSLVILSHKRLLLSILKSSLNWSLILVEGVRSSIQVLILITQIHIWVIAVLLVLNRDLIVGGLISPLVWWFALTVVRVCGILITFHRIIWYFILYQKSVLYFLKYSEIIK